MAERNIVGRAIDYARTKKLELAAAAIAPAAFLGGCRGSEGGAEVTFVPHTPTATVEGPIATATGTPTPTPEATPTLVPTPTPEPAPQIEDVTREINEAFGPGDVNFYFTRAKGRIDLKDPNFNVIWNDLLEAGKRGKPLVCGPSATKEMFAAYNNFTAFTLSFIKKSARDPEGTSRLTAGVLSLPAECTSRFK